LGERRPLAGLQAEKNKSSTREEAAGTIPIAKAAQARVLLGNKFRSFFRVQTWKRAGVRQGKEEACSKPWLPTGPNCQWQWKGCRMPLL